MTDDTNKQNSLPVCRGIVLPSTQRKAIKAKGQRPKSKHSSVAYNALSQLRIVVYQSFTPYVPYDLLNIPSYPTNDGKTMLTTMLNIPLFATEIEITLCNMYRDVKIYFTYICFKVEKVMLIYHVFVATGSEEIHGVKMIDPVHAYYTKHYIRNVLRHVLIKF